MEERDEERNAPHLCRMRIAKALSAFYSGDLPKKALDDIRAQGGRLPYPSSVPQAFSDFPKA